MNETSSGSFCSNDSILQSLMVALPFGGVGTLVNVRVSEPQSLKVNERLSPDAFDRSQWDGLLPRPAEL